MPFTPTPEQLAIIEAFTTTNDNLLIQALAGAAKTSTLVLLAESVPNKEILCLAFNRKIATEMKERLPHWCTASTLNSLGHRAWGAFLRVRLTLDEQKSTKLLRSWIKDNIEDNDEREEFYESYQEIASAIREAKVVGWVPDAIYKPLAHNRLMSNAEFFEHLDLVPTDTQQRCIIEVVCKSVEQGLSGLIDYDDQIYLSTVFRGCTFPYFPTILVDEAQDLSALNHAMLFKISKAGRSRLVAVGDTCQAIYGFRGAHEESMTLLQERFKMRELILSISFRCPKAVVTEARSRAPHMRWPEWAIEGSVTYLKSWSSTDIPELAAIICRNNAPLLSLAFKLLRDGRYPELVGMDLAKRLSRIFEKLGTADMPIDQVELAIELFIEREKSKKKDHDKINDLHECLLIFCEGAKNLGEVVNKVQRIFSASGPIKLMTGHKSKGLEFPHVFFLDPQLIGKRGQEVNLRYVIQTRAQETLTYIESEGFVPRLELKPATEGTMKE